VERDANASTSDNTPLMTEMKRGLKDLATLASVWATMSDDMVEEKGDTFGYNVKCLMGSNLDVGKKCLMYANVLGVAESVDLTKLLREMFFCDFFANNTSVLFKPNLEKYGSVKRQKLRTPALLVQLHKKTSDMITNFSSNLFTVNILQTTSAGISTHVGSAMLCAIGIVRKSHTYYSDLSDSEMADDGDDDDTTPTRISPLITNNADGAPLLSFHVGKKQQFSLYLFNLSEADLCVLKDTVINKDHSSVVIQGDSLFAHQYSNRRNQPDTNVPANGVSLVVNTNEPQSWTTQKYTLKDANNNIFLRVETSLLT